MLLFINKTGGVSCTLYRVSIHLMLLFILELFISFWIVPGFQYISCYSLSKLHAEINCINQRFNTSHVTLYHINFRSINEYLKSFNTSHVTLYLYGIPIDRTKDMFQYISCYSLSILE